MPPTTDVFALPLTKCHTDEQRVGGGSGHRVSHCLKIGLPRSLCMQPSSGACVLLHTSGEGEGGRGGEKGGGVRDCT